MINWLGQELAVGDWVYKARRSGNTTDQMVGKIVSINADKFSGSVRWFAQPSGRKRYDHETRSYIPLPEQRFYARVLNDDAEHAWGRPFRGTNDLDSLIKIEPCPLLDRLKEL